MRMIQLIFVLSVLGFVSGCDSDVETEAVQETQPWDQQRIETLRMPGVVDAPEEIYRKAYDRSMSQITAENLVERLEALEREIEMERSELP